MSTRESWLLKAIQILENEKFKNSGSFEKFNPIRVSVGFPDKKKAVGQWWAPSSTTDGYASIFIHPGAGDPVDILGTLVHELVHDACGAKAGHGPIFKKMALAVGLEGKMRSAGPGKELTAYLEKLAKRLGKFPHSALKPNAKPPGGKQTTRMIRMECGQCGFICRASMSKILEVGAPKCNCSGVQMQVELPDEE